ncbi:hypothetical protein [Streptoalloteichus hindustanus]|uniref:Uncharacterized protein n=1 Tax=Streptoalloteichus hindustanus TaxID=2017 RepID=A0A1M5H1D6_STRHI|nr:hypothetical protein [Streptoalloteichus hindustanus]SHG09784.1 hypothetical protein SAMN05444320_106358 [Streptoalloteichus hindustanus]
MLDEFPDIDEINPGFPYRFHPSKGGLLPWALIGTDFAFFWLMHGSDPEKWTVVVAECALDGYWHYEGSMTSFMLDFVHGRTGLKALEYLSDQKPTFVVDVHESQATDRA